MEEYYKILALCVSSKEVATSTGWVNPDGTDSRSPSRITNLFHSELSEAYEDFRGNNGLDETWYEHVESKVIVTSPGVEPGEWKPCGIPSELADFVIRICQFVGSRGDKESFAKHVDMFSYTPEVNFDDFMAVLHTRVSGVLNALNSANTYEAELFMASSVREVLMFSRKEGIPIWEAIAQKEAFNRTRSFRHGGKRA
jgi:hypothetical protein